ncbi:MAG: hypothetical protein ACOY7U_06535 [Acidobacteriota bacterium]|nr:MAG: hypothetical protein KatS3mg007_1382 [Thermoanaerobaculum sp.]
MAGRYYCLGVTLPELWRAKDLSELDDELEIVRALRSPYCTGAFVEAVAGSAWATSRRRVMVALVRHPRCPRAFAWRALPLLGWHDLLEVLGDPRTPMPVRQQAQGKLVERLPTLTVGEKVSLARQAPPPVLIHLLGEEDTRVIAALLDNPKFAQNHCVRLTAETGSSRVLAQILRHHRWGQVASVRKAALANPAMPVALAVAVLVSLSDDELLSFSNSREFPARVRNLAQQALWVRRLRTPGEEQYLH